MTRRDADDAARGVAHLEVLDEQRLGDELRRQQHRAAGAVGAQAAGLAVRGRDSIRRQANQELLGTAAVGDDRRVRRQPRVLEPRREMRPGERAAEAQRSTPVGKLSSCPSRVAKGGQYPGR